MNQPKKENPWILRIVSAIMTIALAVSSYFLNETMSKIKTIDARVTSIEIRNSARDSNKFSSQDWTIAKTFIDADKLAMDKRITVIETVIPQIMSSLDRIETTLEKTNDRLNK